MLVHCSTLHAFTHNGDADTLQQETASIKTFCRLRLTSFSTTILLVAMKAHHQVKRWRIALTVLITMHIIRYTLYTLTSRPQDILLLAWYLHANIDDLVPNRSSAPRTASEDARALMSVPRL